MGKLWRNIERKVKAPTDEAARPLIRVGICIPAQDQVSATFAYDLARMTAFTAATRRDIELRLFIHRGTLLSQQRTDLAKQAVEARCTHVLWLDSDMRFPKDALIRLLAHNTPVVAANYIARRLPFRPVAARYEDGKRVDVFSDAGEGLVAVDFVGMGCMLVATAVFQELPQPWFDMPFQTEGEYFVSEDVYFCLLLKQSGQTVYVDQELSQKVAHVGEWEYRQEHALAVRQSEAAVGS